MCIRDSCWLGDDEQKDLGKIASVPARLDRIGWNDDAFRAAALHGEVDVKFHEGLGRAAEDARRLDPYDPTRRSFYVRVDGVGFTKWSDEYCVEKPYDGDVHGAFVSAAARVERCAALGVCRSPQALFFAVLRVTERLSRTPRFGHV